MLLFENDFGVGSQVEDDTSITTFLLYYNEAEMKSFKALCKAGMKAEYKNYQDANVSDFLLKVLKEKYGNL